MLDEDAVVTQHAFLSAPQCQQIRDRVLALEPRWIRRADTFFTLGIASYLDAPGRLAEYERQAALHNQVLKSGFDDLYQLLSRFLGSLLGGMVFFDETYSLPGFHVFLVNGYDRSRENVAASAHFDLQWMSAIPEWRGTRTLSFTVPIELPSGGASMEVWHFRHEDALEQRVGAREYAAAHPSQRVPYAPGRMVINDGRMLHAIGRGTDPNPFGRRITLQGHGIETPDGWLLYW
jgi:hypothetical protein